MMILIKFIYLIMVLLYLLQSTDNNFVYKYKSLLEVIKDYEKFY